MSICKPQDKADKRFYFLMQLLDIIARNSEVEVPVHESHGLPTYPIDLEKRALEVRNKLIRVTTVGLFGTGGIGKTTLAKQTFYTISKHFEYTCFVDNVKGIPGHDLQERVLNHFLHHGMKSDKGSTQWFHLKNKTTLIVMDDIDSEDQLKVLPHLKHFATGSRIIMTSRDREVFKFYEDCIIYEVGFLKEDHAKKLFCHYAFGSKDIPDVLIDNVNAVVKKCDGLPLTLEVIGSYLRGPGTDLNVWMETLNSLGRAQATIGGRNDRVWASLRLSYDRLSEEEQEMFLEAALIFFEQPLDHALAAWSTLTIEWKNLVSRSLVREVSTRHFVALPNVFNEYKEIWVYEQLRDLAKNIFANGIMESESDETTNSIVDRLNDNKVQVNPKTKCLSLFYSEDFQKNRTTLQLDSLAKLESLKYMDLVGVSLEGSGKGLTRKISVLNFEGAQRDQLSKFEFNLNNMENLAVLQLSHFQIPKEFPGTLGNLTNLQILRLSDLEGFDHLPEKFGSLRRLRKLELDSLRLIMLPKSFGNLIALEDLTFRDIESLQLPESLGDVSSLVNLTIERCEDLAGVPESFGRCLTSLKELHISDCPSIKCLPESLGDVSSLVKLTIVRCEELAGLPESFGRRLTLLKELYISECPSIKCLPESLGNVFSLVKLTIVRYEELAGLPESFGRRLTLLKELYISECPSIKCLPESLGDVSSLVKLTIHYCQQLTGLPDSLGSSLTSLEELNIDLCSLIKCLPECFSRLPGLEQLNIKRCHGFEELGDGFGNLSSLRQLSLTQVALDRLPASFSLLSTLVILEIRTYGQLRSLPDDFGKLRALKELYISSPELEALHENFQFPKFLRNIKIACPKFESLPESLYDLALLERLHLDVQRMESLPILWICNHQTHPTPSSPHLPIN